MNAYDEIYLTDAAANLGDMFDYAVNDLGYDGDTFMQMFIVSGIAEQFAHGNVKYIAGKSGFELADEIIRMITHTGAGTQPAYRARKTAAYWTGWILARYQWQCGMSYALMQKLLPFSEVCKMYPTLHESDAEKFFETANRTIKKNAPSTNLRQLRETFGISQTDLATKSGVHLRSIQMYEQRNKDINKAQVMTLAKIARTLGCSIEDFLEVTD
ncbi:MAG: helix-turn-helix transcriptional regulator [Clostridiales Family XIII bacterium]|jgi:DNA-binding XRE family transcriptional regulator|nr:helix-turn-helix transcriptional regulator [Clostridiales Family XIII bacterium]